jgi:hypothetical protein
MMIEAEMWGMMPSAKIAMRSTGAAGKGVENAKHAAALILEGLREGVGIDAGKRDIGAEPIDKQAPSVNQMRFLRSSAFEKAAKFRLMLVVQQPMPCTWSPFERRSIKPDRKSF